MTTKIILPSTSSDDQAASPSIISPQSIDTLALSEIDDFPDFDSIDHGQIFTLSLQTKTTEFTHGIHRFPAKFIPQIPRWALKQFSTPSSHVIDPFMGSGTTLVEGLLAGVKITGYDIDPLARLISQAKTALPTSDRIAELGLEINAKWKYTVEQLQPPMPDIVNFDHWFSLDAWAKLQSLLNEIHTLACSSTERDFLLVIFSSIIRWVSNADDQSQKTYVSGTNPKSPPDVAKLFWRSFQRAVTGLQSLEVARNPAATIHITPNTNALALGLDPESIDLVITSPPYLDSVDYMYNLMLEYFWLGSLIGVKDRKTFNQLRRNSLGAKNPNSVSATLPEGLADLITIDQLPLARRGAVIAYFQSMASHFRVVSQAMRMGARYVLVIGNSQTEIGIVPVHDCLVRLAAAEGLELEKAFAYRIRRHYMKFPRRGRGGIILIDWIITLQKVNRSVIIPDRLPLPWAILDQHSVSH